MASRLIVCAAVLLTAGCASMAPPHERPAVALPAAYPHNEPSHAATPV